MYLAPACTFWLALGSMALEHRTMVQEGAFGLMVRWRGACCSAVASMRPGCLAAWRQ
jgi:hypothetical protein